MASTLVSHPKLLACLPDLLKETGPNIHLNTRSRDPLRAPISIANSLPPEMGCDSLRYRTAQIWVRGPVSLTHSSLYFKRHRSSIDHLSSNDPHRTVKAEVRAVDLFQTPGQVQLHLQQISRCDPMLCQLIQLPSVLASCQVLRLPKRQSPSQCGTTIPTARHSKI